MPFCSTLSCRPPAVTQIPIEADYSRDACVRVGNDEPSARRCDRVWVVMAVFL